MGSGFITPTIVVGDVHGCLEELDELLALVYRPGDNLIFAGDLVDRGPDPVGVCARVRELGARCVIGNHEEKHIRWNEWELRVNGGVAKKNPMRPFSEQRTKEHKELLTKGHINWMHSLPNFIRLSPTLVVVHAGLEPDVTVEEQKPNVLYRCRYIDPEGKMGKLDPREGDQFWTERWEGPEDIVYGHHVHNLESPVVMVDMGIEINGTEITRRTERLVKTYGIDTGCCFGGRLTAAVFNEESEIVCFVQVPAKEKYAHAHGF